MLIGVLIRRERVTTRLTRDVNQLGSEARKAAATAGLAEDVEPPRLTDFDVVSHNLVCTECWARGGEPVTFACGNIPTCSNVGISPHAQMWDYPDTKDAIMPTVQVRKFRDIGPVIKAVRESRAVRQEDLAEQLAFSRDYLIDLEKGKGSLYMTRLFRTLNELGITVTLTYQSSNGETSDGDA